MKKTELFEAIESRKLTTKEALQLVWDNVNKGQKKQILKKPEVKSMFDLYHVEYEEE